MLFLALIEYFLYNPYIMARRYGDGVKIVKGKRIREKTLIPGIYVDCALDRCTTIASKLYDFLGCTITSGVYHGSSCNIVGGTLTDVYLDKSVFAIGNDTDVRRCHMYGMSIYSDVRAYQCIFENCTIHNYIFVSITGRNAFVGSVVSTCASFELFPIQNGWRCRYDTRTVQIGFGATAASKPCPFHDVSVLH